MRPKHLLSLVLALCFFSIYAQPEELPVPTFHNSVIISIEHNPYDSVEVDYIKNSINFGLYAWLSFSRTHIDPVLDWHSDWSMAAEKLQARVAWDKELGPTLYSLQGIQSFKDNVNSLINIAKEENFMLHIVLCSGLARGLPIYKDAKEEDIRNSQWYNDNNIASDDQIINPDVLSKNVFGTLSRYARKMRANLEAKATAALIFLKQKMDEDPNVFSAFSGWGEAEFNSGRMNSLKTIQDYFCDYSPFAVLEFRDWICHTGMYDNTSGKYKGEGYSQGGIKYQGLDGLNQFNLDFNTNFTSWDLKHYNWSLSDDYDENPQDYINNDPNRIPFSSYSHGNMLPSQGTNVIEGGFDPPRVMGYPVGFPGHDIFWDLWNLFRETMVHNFVKDLAKWASEADIPPEKWYSHQIPADYLWGKNPDFFFNNARYYSSASPLWTGDISPYGSLGVTMYDVKYPDCFVRTTKYAAPAAPQISPNWAVMEYDAEAFPPGMEMNQSTPEFILEQYLNLYSYSPHIINFWRWWDDTGKHRIKGTNKETALQNFIQKIRDKARGDINTVFTPPEVTGFSGNYAPAAGVSRITTQTSGSMQLNISGEIWSGHPWKWKDWGDFLRFEIYRSNTPNFIPSAQNFLATTTEYSYSDTAIEDRNAYFYKIKAVNSESSTGPPSAEIMLIPTTDSVSVLHVTKKKLFFGANQTNPSPAPADFLITNIGSEGTTISWRASTQNDWIQIRPTNGNGEGKIETEINATGLAPGTHTGTVVVEDANAFNSPQTVDVQLTVYAPGEENNPFGSFDTPVNLTEGITGAIPVTGWVLDDIGVEKVDIWRDPAASETSVHTDGLIYIGDAVFVKGARQDVEAAYPNYPQNDRAGWGYMMLTNFLPNQGNGTYLIHAIAHDSSGSAVTLGIKTITCSNNSAVKPFGTIDEPKQGAEISGLKWNSGWALTPQPNEIPKDGSTIWIWIDGKKEENPYYNQYREDIATLFPDYANSYGAVGAYLIDTTAYANGVHTIAWSVKDNAGNSDGIGSRFFSVSNFSGTTTPLPAVEVLRYRPDEEGRLKIHTDGPQQIEIEELERIEMKFSGSSGHRYIGWGKNKSQSLPIGSTLDKEKGIFYWMPGPGFLGTHTLHFAVTDERFISKPVQIVVLIVPKKYKIPLKIRRMPLHK